MNTIAQPDLKEPVTTQPEPENERSEPKFPRLTAGHISTSPGETAELQSFMDDLFEDLAPETPFEEAITEMIVLQIIRRQRLAKFEMVLLDCSSNAITFLDLITKLTKLDKEAERSIAKNLKWLRESQAERKARASEDSEEAKLKTPPQSFSTDEQMLEELLRKGHLLPQKQKPERDDEKQQNEP